MFYQNLAKGIFNLQHIYDPEMILIGGSISDRDDFVSNLDRHIEIVRSKISIVTVKPEVKTCTHKKDANIIGALTHHLKEYKF